ncbi:MAG: PAS-domain containing protein, partial [Pikeienuella sp.]
MAAKAHRRAPDRADPIRLLLVDGVLVDVPERARRALDLDADGQAGWPEVVNALASRFPDLDGLDLCGSGGLGGDGASTTFEAADGAYVVIKAKDSQAVVEIWDASADAVDRHRAFRLQSEIDVLRAALDSAPDPIWHTRQNGTLVWANAAFKKVQGDEHITLAAQNTPRSGEVRRVRLNETQDQSGEWFDLRCVPRDDGTLNYAVNVESVVKAEIAQRNFVQTLAKTFAHLPIGLAIFDRNRQLALFNPALIDLTALPAEFLSGRPNLMTFFDTLREARMMPEPKNYSDWREQLAELVRATCDDRYSETWTLPSGLTYKITGRPHPDGAIAFLIEDISAEISLTRRFRAELSQSQAALDAIDDGIAVFSPLGVLTMCNQSYRKTWGTDPETTQSDVN